MLVLHVVYTRSSATAEKRRVSCTCLSRLAIMQCTEHCRIGDVQLDYCLLVTVV